MRTTESGTSSFAGVSGAQVHLRAHLKDDGRLVRLYGRSPQDQPPFPASLQASSSGGSLRWHPLRREWVVYAAARQNRTYKPSAALDPLAPMTADGAETEIPFADFELAIFDNRFPSLTPTATIGHQLTDDIVTRPPRGACEVVVYTSAQSGSLYTVGQARRELLVDAWTERYLSHFDAGRRFVLPFESRGEEVGVTLHHPHGQIYAFDELPPVQAQMREAFAGGYRLGRAVAGWGDYAVAQAGGIGAYCPPFARFPYEVWLIPEERHAGPWTFSKEEAKGFAELLGEVTRRYDAFFDRPTAYMLSLHASPMGNEEHWHFTAQFYPILRSKDKVKFLASVEQASGMFTVDVLPETAAVTLREIP